MKLIEKTRVESKVKKEYDRAKTPYQRVLDSSFISGQTKEKLEQGYAELNPVSLKREISRTQDKLSELARVKRQVNKDEQRTNFEYIST